MAKNPITSRAARKEGITKDRPGFQGFAKGGAAARPRPPKRPKRGR